MKCTTENSRGPSVFNVISVLEEQDFIISDTSVENNQFISSVGFENVTTNQLHDTSSSQDKVIPISDTNCAETVQQQLLPVTELCDNSGNDNAQSGEKIFLPSLESEKNWYFRIAQNDSITNYIQLLEIAEMVNGDSTLPMDSRPDWVDLEKLRRGQTFAKEYFFGLMFSEMLSLILLFLYRENIDPLIYTGHSDTPFKAFKRYLSTVLRVKSWYEGDLWKETSHAHKNLKTVRDMHQAYRSRLNSTDPRILEEKCTLKPPLWSELSDKIKEDINFECPFSQAVKCQFISNDKKLFINQSDMAVTQFGFVGLMIVYPSAFGAARASQEDLEGFVHLWRCIGYLLGIEDRYNFCAGDLETVRQRTRDIIELKMKPKLCDVSRSWEHMYRCVVEGISYYVPGLTFEVSVMYLFRLLGLRSTHLEAALTYHQKFMYRFISLVMYYLLQFPPYRVFSNWLLKLAIKKASAHTPAWIREHEGKVYPYNSTAQDCK